MAKDLEYYLAQVRRIAEHRDKDAEKKIRKIYKELLKDLQHFVSDEYAKYAEDDNLTYGILQSKGEFARFLEEAQKIINEGTPAASKEIRQVVNDVYKLCYDGMVDGVQKSSNNKELAETFKGLKNATPEQIKAAVQNPVGGLTLSDVLEKHRREIVYDIKKTIGIGLMNGDRYSTMAKRLTERVDIDYRKALLVVRTETHRVQEEGFYDSATEINDALEQGVTSMRLFKTWKTMHDERVRHTRRANHRIMNNVSIPLDDDFDLLNGVKAKIPGQSGSASNDCNCRCFVKYELKEVKEKKNG